jgi:HD-GYP domain-containing protein (c-di-GMP phosphodiesterase class II)
MMNALKLLYPVHAPGGQVLLPALSPLTDTIITELIDDSHLKSFPFQKITEYGTIAADLQALYDRPPYDRIFAGSRRKKALGVHLDRVELPVPILEIIGYFKTNDPYTYRHLLVVFALSMLLAQDFMDSAEALQSVAQACISHDLGKFCVPLAVLKKSTLLGQDEKHYLEHHSAAGYVLLSYYLKNPQHSAAITARDHHERRDGSGYPRGILLNNPIVEIVAACDVFDALVASRPYRATAYDVRTALEEITDMASRGAISWDVVKALVSCNRKDRPPIHKCILSREKRGAPPDDNLYQGAGVKKQPTINPVRALRPSRSRIIKSRIPSAEAQFPNRCHRFR